MNSNLLYGLDDQHITWLNERIGLHHEVINSWMALKASAAKDGIEVEIVSGYRDFSRQLNIWNKKCCGQLNTYDKNNKTINLNELTPREQLTAILLFSALPGASRHHWGTDIDIYAPNLLPPETKLMLQPWEYQSNGPLAELSNWLKENASKYGFYLPYDKYRGGVSEEPWHLSYKPLASAFEEEFSVRSLIDIINVNDVKLKECIIENIDFIYRQYITNVNH